MHVPQGCRQAGVTLIEQIMVLALVAVLVGIACPPMGRFVRRQELRSAQFDYIAALRYARSAAVEQNVRILFCPSVDGHHCSDYTGWSHGWLIARDRNRDGRPDGTPLRVGTVAKHVIVQGSAGRRRVHFRPDGMALGSNLSLLFCTRGDRDQAFMVVVSNSGRVRGTVAPPAKARSCKASDRG